jgi:hypothetical protein
MLGVDLVGSRRIWPAQVGCRVGLDGSRRIQKDRLDDQMDDQGASDRKSDAKASNSCCRPPNSGDDRPARPPPDRVDRLTAGPRFTPSSWAAPFRAGPSFDRRALTELLQSAGGARSPLRPRAHRRPQTGAAWPTIRWPRPSTAPEGSSSRRRSPWPAEGAVDHGALAGGELDPNALALQWSAARSRSTPAFDSC